MCHGVPRYVDCNRHVARDTVTRDTQRSSNLLPLLNRLLIRLHIDVASAPDGHSLDEDTFFFPLLNISHHVEPSANVKLLSLDLLEHMVCVDICDNMWGGRGVVVLQAQSRGLDGIFIDAAGDQHTPLPWTSNTVPAKKANFHAWRACSQVAQKHEV
jgi:hypothetical protein